MEPSSGFEPESSDYETLILPLNYEGGLVTLPSVRLSVALVVLALWTRVLAATIASLLRLTLLLDMSTN